MEIFRTGIGWETLSPRQRLTSTPFAMRAASSNMAGDADTVDGIHAADLEESNEIDTDIAAHMAIPDAHHTKTTSFAELTDMATDEQISDDITVNYTKNADKVDGKHASEFGDGHSLNAADGNPTNVVYVNNEGNVGIGTMNPQAKLHVSEPWVLGTSSGLLPVWWGKGINGWLTSSSGILYEGGGTVWAHLFSAYGGGDIVRFGTSAGKAEEPDTKVVITNTGNVGIGTTSPEEKLDITGNIFIKTSDDNPGVGTGQVPIGFENVLQFGNRDENSDPIYLERINLFDDLTELRVNIGDNREEGISDMFSVGTYHAHTAGNPWISAFTVFSNGNVGIGTTSPKVGLHLTPTNWNAPVGNHEDLAIESHNAGIGLYSLKESLASSNLKLVEVEADGSIADVWTMGRYANDNPQWSGTDDNGSFHIKYGNTTSYWEHPSYFSILKNGNVGIGTINPQGTLDVNGSIYQRGSQLHADYVFEPDYKLESIEEHSEFMWKEKHLKAISKAKVDENGKEIVEIGSHQRGIIEELEKAHIYIEQLHNRNNELEERLVKLEEKLAKLEGLKINQ